MFFHKHAGLVVIADSIWAAYGPIKLAPLVTKMLNLPSVTLFAALPPDVRKGCAFPVNALVHSEATPPARRRSRKIRVDTAR